MARFLAFLMGCAAGGLLVYAWRWEPPKRTSLLDMMKESRKASEWKVVRRKQR